MGECGECKIDKPSKQCKPSLGSLASLDPVSVADYSGVRGSRWPELCLVVAVADCRVVRR